MAPDDRLLGLIAAAGVAATECWSRPTEGPIRAAACQKHNAPLRTLAAVIFDVDGVLIDSPHERAWREALEGITDPARLTTEIYQAHVAGKPRLSGARAVLEQLGVPDAGQRTPSTPSASSGGSRS